MISIEPATTADVEILSDFLAQLFDQESEFTAQPDAHAKGLLSIINDERIGNILVAKKNGDILGMVNMVYTISTALGSKEAFIEDLFVEKKRKTAWYWFNACRCRDRACKKKRQYENWTFNRCR